MKNVNASAAGRPASDQSKLVGLTSLSEELAPQIDAAKREAAQQDANQDFDGFARGNDAHGAVGYLADRVDNRDRVLASALTGTGR